MRLVDADKADVEFITCYYADHCYIEDVQEWLDEQPTIEAKPVVHGEWEKVGDEKDWRCTACKSVFCFPVGDPIRLKHNYCSDCGADMRERKET
jgi:hypothetical protein